MKDILNLHTQWSLELHHSEMKLVIFNYYSMFRGRALVWKRSVGCWELINGKSAVALGCVGAEGGACRRQSDCWNILSSVPLCPLWHGQVWSCLLPSTDYSGAGRIANVDVSCFWYLCVTCHWIPE